ncbi:hypothetical protein U0070_024302 [Myodes glareolus]|uniref:Uncharacterized protein n=1 Tax=Myodes glareolus TaxID=447135 RepID=A0AAW0I8L8_MYOGA
MTHNNYSNDGDDGDEGDDSDEGDEDDNDERHKQQVPGMTSGLKKGLHNERLRIDYFKLNFCDNRMPAVILQVSRFEGQLSRPFRNQRAHVQACVQDENGAECGQQALAAWEKKAVATEPARVFTLAHRHFSLSSITSPLGSKNTTTGAIIPLIAAADPVHKTSFPNAGGTICPEHRLEEKI